MRVIETKLKAVGEGDKRIRIVEDETKRFFEANETNSWPAARYRTAYRGGKLVSICFCFVCFRSNNFVSLNFGANSVKPAG